MHISQTVQQNNSNSITMYMQSIWCMYMYMVYIHVDVDGEIANACHSHIRYIIVMSDNYHNHSVPFCQLS